MDKSAINDPAVLEELAAYEEALQRLEAEIDGTKETLKELKAQHKEQVNGMRRLIREATAPSLFNQPGGNDDAGVE